ncbi:MAG: mandelate racemase/muconate lactonizing enzyme family protein [Betaproteobacteria bacterium]|nr:mandelate racemase/muconate lactonizing enzyme family protein [Betaproteobacteria bacterium]
MKIKNIRASLHHLIVNVPLFDKPTVSRKFVFCTVEIDTGIVGHGLCGGQYLGASIVTAINRDLKDAVLGMDPRDTEAIHDHVWWKLNNRAMTGVVTTALSAFDIACWDIHGKHNGRSIAQLLGGHSNSAEIYVTFGFKQYSIEQLVEAAKLQVKAGTQRLKMVVGDGTASWREDAARVRAVRDAIGDDRDLMIDANYMFSPLEAKMLCRAIEDCNLTWFEEPVYAIDARNLAELKRETRIPFAAGQMTGNRWRFKELIAAGAVDIVQPNPCYSGGYTETQKVAHMAQAFNLPIANGGGWPLHNMHSIAGLMNGLWVEFHLGMQAVGEAIFINPPQPENNRIKIPDAPGLGFEPNYDVLKDCKID